MSKKISIITIGKIKEPYLKSGVLEYAKRLKPYCSLEIVNLKDRGIERESLEIGGMLGSNCYILDEKGAELSSLQFSKLLLGREKISFFVGGSDGISLDVKKKAKLISFSKMTFTHEMCSLFLLEQIYRGFMIGTGKKYHR